MDGETGARRRGLGPLLGALALALVVGGVAMAVALHGRPTAKRPSPSPSATPGASSPRPSPTPAGAAPVSDGATAAWDSTHQELVAYSATGSAAPGGVAVWRGGAWLRVSPGVDAPGGGGVLVDMPSLRGVLLVTTVPGPPTQDPSPVWLWNGSAWQRLGTVTFARCLVPASAAWDPVHGEALLLAGDECVGDPTVLPTELWSFDGHAWTSHGAVPGDQRWPVLAWDPPAAKVEMLLAPDSDHPAAGDRGWWWTGRDWTPSGSLGDALAPVQLVGAAWDARAGGVVAMPGAAGPPLAYLVRSGAWSLLHAGAYPPRILAVAADSTHARMLVLGREPVSVNGTPDPTATAWFLLTWDGSTWRHA